MHHLASQAMDPNFLPDAEPNPFASRLLSGSTQPDQLWNAGRLRRVIDRESPRDKSGGARFESYAQSATAAGSEGSRTIVGF